MFIYIARHAWAHEFGDPRWPDDSQRELEVDGAERYMRVVEAIFSLILRLPLVVGAQEDQQRSQ